MKRSSFCLVDETQAGNKELAIWRGDEQTMNFRLAIVLQLQPTIKARL